MCITSPWKQMNLIERVKFIESCHQPLDHSKLEIGRSRVKNSQYLFSTKDGISQNFPFRLSSHDTDQRFWFFKNLFVLQARDALISEVSRLVVRRAPTAVVIKQIDNMSSVPGISDNNETIDVLENTNVTLECSSVGGQPPPRLYWELPESLPSWSLSETVRNESAVSVISVLVTRFKVIQT